MFSTFKKLIWPLTSGEKTSEAPLPDRPVSMEDIVEKRVPGEQIVSAYNNGDLSLYSFAVATALNRVTVADFYHARVSLRVLYRNQEAAEKSGLVGHALRQQGTKFNPFDPGIPSPEEHDSACKMGYDDE